MHEWELELAKLEAEAVVVLKNEGLPIDPDSLVGVEAQDRLVLNAILIILNIQQFRKHLDSNRIDRALDRLVYVFQVYEEFWILRDVPGYERGMVLSENVIKHINHGAKMSKERKPRKSKFDAEYLKSCIDMEYKNDPRKGIGAIRDIVGEKHGITGRQIARITNNYPWKMKNN